MGEEWFDEYWINYGIATMLKDGKPIKITNLKAFLEFKGRTDLWEKIVTRTKKIKTTPQKDAKKPAKREGK